MKYDRQLHRPRAGPAAAGQLVAMSDSLYELLSPYLESPSAVTRSGNDPNTASYLTRLSILSLSDLTSTEPESLLQAAQSHLRSLQALSKRSHKSVIASSAHLSRLSDILPNLGTQAAELQDGIPAVETVANDFAQKYDRSIENVVLDRRKRALLLARNIERVTDVLDLPALLRSTVSAAQGPSVPSSASSATSYASALDLHAHIRRLSALYPHSGLVESISKQAETEIQNLTTILITSLQTPNLKLASAMRTVGWLRRVAPDLAGDSYSPAKGTRTNAKSLNVSPASASGEGPLGSMFLVCRLRSLITTLDALEPLRDLADQETQRRKAATNGKQQLPQSALGSQSERYMKRFIEIFREQSFNIISMYKSIFPTSLPSPEANYNVGTPEDPLLPLPSPLSSFTLHLVDLLTRTLQTYLPNITDRQARESLLTQVLYCAGSLGRLGADFGVVVALLEDAVKQDDEEEEWVQVVKKHRVQAGRLEILARGVGTGSRKGSTSLEASSPTSAIGAG